MVTESHASAAQQPDVALDAGKSQRHELVELLVALLTHRRRLYTAA